MTKIKLGDRVRFVNENMQGVVTKIDGNTAGVTIEDDFEIPVLLNEIVRIQDIVEKPKEEKPVTSKPHFVKIHSGIHIAFDKINDTNFELKLHNSETDWIYVAVYLYKNKQYELFCQSPVELESSITLTKLNIEDFNTWNQLLFQVTFIENKHQNNLRNQLIRAFKITQKEFFAAFKNCYFLGRQAITFRLDDPLSTLDLQKLQQRDFSEPVNERSVKPATHSLSGNIIDLHAEKLMQNHAALPASQILDVQLEAMAKALEAAYIGKQQSVIFIHGVGNHFLKNKLRNYLTKQKQWVKEVKDADMLKFGGGATEVILN